MTVPEVWGKNIPGPTAHLAEISKAKKQFDSSKTIDVLEREKDPLRKAEQRKNFSIRLAPSIPLDAATLHKLCTYASSGLHQATLDQLPVGAVQPVFCAVLDNGLSLHPADETGHAFLKGYLRGKTESLAGS